jgi:peptidoglycan/LPS O-acetylase OafA/YrhL
MKSYFHALFNDTWAGIQGAYWSIGLEAQLYALFSIFILSTKRFGFRTVLIFGVITSLAFLVVAYAIDLSHVFLLSGLGRFVHFCAGILVAKILFLNQMHRFRVIAIIGTCCIVLSQLKNQLSIPTFIPFVEIMSASGFLCLLILTCLNDDLVKWLSSRWLRWLGGVSYSVFLIHQNTAWYIGEFFKKIFPVNQELLMPMFIIVALPICVCLGLILNRFVEEPFHRGWPIRKA